MYQIFSLIQFKPITFYHKAGHQFTVVSRRGFDPLKAAGSLQNLCFSSIPHLACTLLIILMHGILPLLWLIYNLSVPRYCFNQSTFHILIFPGACSCPALACFLPENLIRAFSSLLSKLWMKTMDNTDLEKLRFTHLFSLWTTGSYCQLLAYPLYTSSLMFL